MALSNRVEQRIEDEILSISRSFDAPAELLFKLWADPAHRVRWWGPSGMALATCEVDFRVGGEWRCTMARADGYQRLAHFAPLRDHLDERQPGLVGAVAEHEHFAIVEECFEPVGGGSTTTRVCNITQPHMLAAVPERAAVLDAAPQLLIGAQRVGQSLDGCFGGLNQAEGQRPNQDSLQHREYLPGRQEYSSPDERPITSLLRGRFAAFGWRGSIRRRRVRLLLTVHQPDVVDRVVDGVERRAVGEHPAGEDPLRAAL